MPKKIKEIPISWAMKDIGIGLLESITTGLYENPFYVLREYAQNSIDAEPTEIKITVGATAVGFGLPSNLLVIHDNGIGMNEEEIKKARRVGVSEKSPDKAGFRGIGIWSGLQ